VITTYWRKIIFTITCVCVCVDAFFYIICIEVFFFRKKNRYVRWYTLFECLNHHLFLFFFFFFSSCFFFCTDVRQKRKEKSNHIKPKTLIYCQLYFLSYAYLLSFSSVCILFVSLNTHTHTHTDSYLSVCIFRRNHF